MIRIWGGGHYASDALMDLCDRKGMMVWQDFAYACAMFPTDTAFLAEAKAEAKEKSDEAQPPQAPDNPDAPKV